MKNNDNQVLNFEEQTPNMHIGQTKSALLYEKAFLSCESMCRNEFAQNTTTWD